MTQSFDGNRRQFLKSGLLALTGVAACHPALAAMPRIQGTKALSFHNLHTDEKLHVTYWRNGTYDRGALAKIDHVLRDHYSGDVFPMSPRLMDLLFDLQAKTHHEGAIEVISGYRSPHTNLVLAKATDGVAKRSYHMKGMAVDLVLPGVKLSKVHKTALSMKRGGVGFYPSSGFVHVDVGPVRKW